MRLREGSGVGLFPPSFPVSILHIILPNLCQKQCGQITFSSLRSLLISVSCLLGVGKVYVLGVSFQPSPFLLLFIFF